MKRLRTALSWLARRTRILLGGRAEEERESLLDACLALNSSLQTAMVQAHASHTQEMAQTLTLLAAVLLQRPGETVLSYDLVAAAGQAAVDARADADRRVIILEVRATSGSCCQEQVA
jgi:hypothetical protein